MSDNGVSETDKLNSDKLAKKVSDRLVSGVIVILMTLAGLLILFAGFRPVIESAITPIPIGSMEAVLTGLGAVGTLFLAYATYRSVISNKQLVALNEELVAVEQKRWQGMQKREEKPRIRQVLVDIVKPAHDRLGNNLTRIVDNGSDIGWRTDDLTTQLELLGSLIKGDTMIIETFEEKRPQTVSKFRQYDEEIEELEERAGELSYKLREPTKNRIQAKEINYTPEERSLESFLIDKMINQSKIVLNTVEFDNQLNPIDIENLNQLLPVTIDPEITQMNQYHGFITAQEYETVEQMSREFLEQLDHVGDLSTELLVELEDIHERFRDDYDIVESFIDKSEYYPRIDNE